MVSTLSPARAVTSEVQSQDKCRMGRHWADPKPKIDARQR